jgi:hypothetical protein
MRFLPTVLMLLRRITALAYYSRVCDKHGERNKATQTEAGSSKTKSSIEHRMTVCETTD